MMSRLVKEFAFVDGEPRLRILEELRFEKTVVASFASEDELRRSPLLPCGTADDDDAPQHKLAALMAALAPLERDSRIPHRRIVGKYVVDADLVSRTLDAFSYHPSFSTLPFEAKKTVVRAFVRRRQDGRLAGRLPFEEALSAETYDALLREVNREVNAALLSRLEGCRDAADLDVLMSVTYMSIRTPSDSLLAHAALFYDETMRREYGDAMSRFFDCELAALTNALPVELAHDVWGRMVAMHMAEHC